MAFRTMNAARRAQPRKRAGRHLRRDRRIIALSLTVAVGASAAVGGQLALAAPAPEPVVEAAAAPLSDGVLDLGFTGDTMLGDGAMSKITEEGPESVLAGVAPMLSGFDFTIINSEVPFTTSTAPNNPGAKYSYASDPAYLPVLHALGVDAINLGNNHAMDRGPVGLADTLQAAADTGVAAFGAGADQAQASMPLMVRSGQLDVAVVSFGENFGPLQRSTDVSAGMLPLKPDRIERGIRVARDNGADRVVAFVHWGDNYADVNDQQRYWAGLFAEAGYDVVIGSGSHTLQPVDVIGDMPVVYSMGNFVFGAPGRFASYGRPGLGAVVGLRWADDGAGELSIRVIETDNLLTDYVARPVTGAELGPARKILGPLVAWSGDVGSVTF
jgi:hypothetical protein